MAWVQLASENQLINASWQRRQLLHSLCTELQTSHRQGCSLSANNKERNPALVKAGPALKLRVTNSTASDRAPPGGLVQPGDEARSHQLAPATAALLTKHKVQTRKKAVLLSLKNIYNQNHLQSNIHTPF
jgi:hypothetical protein